MTPDIKQGDVVSVKFADGTQGDTKTSGGTASDAVVDLVADPTGRTVRVSGQLDPSFNRAFVEQRIINPDMVDMVVGKRDVRALPGPLTPAAKGGYSSGLDIADDGSYVATYVFDDVESANAAANAPLGERLMAWEVRTPRRTGSPHHCRVRRGRRSGHGRLPSGPKQSTPQAGSVTVVPNADKTSVNLNWSPATAATGASPVAAYSVLAISPAATAR